MYQTVLLGILDEKVGSPALVAQVVLPHVVAPSNTKAIALHASSFAGTFENVTVAAVE